MRIRSRFLGLILCILVCHSYAQDSAVGILYPLTKNRTQKQITTQILDTVKKNRSFSVKTLEVDEKMKDGAIEKWVNKHKISTIVSLGNQAIAQLPEIENIKNIHAAIQLPSSDKAANTSLVLTPKPSTILEELQTLKPEVTRVIMVSSPKYTWYQDYLNKAFSQSKLTLDFRTVADQKTSANMFNNIINSGIGSETAILIHDNSIMLKPLFNEILSKAWSNKFVVISTNIGHVKSGALFAKYPDFEQLGIKLNEILESPPHDKVIFLDFWKTAIHLKTAEHIGVTISQSEQQRFDLIFPMTR